MQGTQKSLYIIITTIFAFLLIIVAFITSTRSYQQSSTLEATPFPETQTSPMRYVGAGCKIGGCSGTVCVDETEEDPITTCEYRNEYACYQTAICEKQADGICGWKQTDELKACLENPPTEVSPSSEPYL